MNFLAAVLASALLALVGYGVVPLWGAQLALWALWHAWLAPQTWLEFLGGMNFKRMKDGGPLRPPGTVILPYDVGEHCNEPDGEWIIERMLYPGAAFDNFILAQYAALLYFRVVPIPWRDRGLTMLLNRLEGRGDRVGYKARAVKKRWLSRYDPDGFHK